MNSFTDLTNRMNSPAALGVVGYSGAGKTTLLAALLPMLVSQGLRTAVIKNTHPDFEIDYPGKDSHLLRTAGAAQVLLASPARWALVAEQHPSQERPLDYWLSQLPPGEQDLVLVEGFRAAAIPKLEIYRAVLAKPLLCSDDPLIMAVAVACCEVPQALPRPLPCFDLNDHTTILHWILSYTGLARND